RARRPDMRGHGTPIADFPPRVCWWFTPTSCPAVRRTLSGAARTADVGDLIMLLLDVLSPNLPRCKARGATMPGCVLRRLTLPEWQRCAERAAWIAIGSPVPLGLVRSTQLFPRASNEHRRP